MKPTTPNAIAKRLFQVITQYIVLGAILFISAGTIKWFWAWAYMGLGLLVLVVNIFALPRDLISERGQPKDNIKKFDKTIKSLTIVPALAIFLIAGLDRRFAWSNQVGLASHILGAVLFVFGNLMFTWSMVSNRNFSTMVRIQHDRGHKVATNGPYKFIRHPGYTGYIAFTLAAPIIVGSRWAIVPAMLVAILFVIRTVLEDKTLRNELDGYKEYAMKVKHKLIPMVW